MTALLQETEALIDIFVLASKPFTPNAMTEEIV